MTGSNTSIAVNDALQRLSPALRRFARALASAERRGGASDDLVREGITRAWTSGDRSEAELRTACYAGIVAANRSRPKHGATGGAAQSAAPESSASELVSRLPLDQREVLLLVVLEQLRYDDVAAVLGISRSSVVARLARARSALGSFTVATPHRAPYLRVVK